MNTKNYIFQYDCYQELTHVGVKQDYCHVDVYALTEAEALKKVKALVTKKEYDLVKVSEYFAPSKDRPDFMISVQAYDLMNVETGVLDNSKQMIVWADSVDRAIETVRKVFKRKFYRVSSVIQKLKDEV